MPFDNFTKKGQARAKVNIGRTQAEISRSGRGAMGAKLSNADRLKLSRAAAANLVEGTMESNRLRRNQTTDEAN